MGGGDGLIAHHRADGTVPTRSRSYSSSAAEGGVGGGGGDDDDIGDDDDDGTQETSYQNERAVDGDEYFDGRSRDGYEDEEDDAIIARAAARERDRSVRMEYGEHDEDENDDYVCFADLGGGGGMGGERKSERGRKKGHDDHDDNDGGGVTSTGAMTMTTTIVLSPRPPPVPADSW